MSGRTLANMRANDNSGEAVGTNINSPGLSVSRTG
jgi:hypothetical protein